MGNDTNKNGVIDKEELQSLPFFFDKSDIQTFLGEQAKLQPDLAKKVKIEVTSLFLVLDNMVTKDNKPGSISDIIQFVPSRSSQEYILKNTKQATTPQVAPQATPAKN